MKNVDDDDDDDSHNDLGLGRKYSIGQFQYWILCERQSIATQKYSVFDFLSILKKKKKMSSFYKIHNHLKTTGKSYKMDKIKNVLQRSKHLVSVSLELLFTFILFPFHSDHKSIMIGCGR